MITAGPREADPGNLVKALWRYGGANTALRSHDGALIAATIAIMAPERLKSAVFAPQQHHNAWADAHKNQPRPRYVCRGAVCKSTAPGKA